MKFWRLDISIFIIPKLIRPVALSGFDSLAVVICNGIGEAWKPAHTPTARLVATPLEDCLSEVSTSALEIKIHTKETKIKQLAINHQRRIPPAAGEFSRKIASSAIRRDQLQTNLNELQAMPCKSTAAAISQRAKTSPCGGEQY